MSERKEEIYRENGRKIILWIDDTTDKVYRIDVVSPEGELIDTSHKANQITREEALKMY